MSHDYHEKLPGYHADQILYDGCRECEERAKFADHGISTLDSGNFARACRRAREWNRNGLPNLSEAEMPLLSVLQAVDVQFDRLGIPSISAGIL